MTPTKAEELAARTSPVHQPVHGWTDADADAARLALELECILTDRDTPMPLTSRWWESAHEALALHRQRIDDELREIECPPDPDAVDRALEADALMDEAAAELRRLSAVEADYARPLKKPGRLRWRREKQKYSWRPQIHAFTNGDVRFVTVQQCDGGWFWYGLGQNTARQPAATLEQAKSDAEAHARAAMKGTT